MNIVPLEPNQTPAALELLISTIVQSQYYTQAAKHTEIAELTAQLEAQPHTALVALESDQVLGLVVWSGLEAGLLWLSWIVTAPEARGRGVALALLDGFHHFAKVNGVHKTWCDSRIGNIPSQALLEKAGYKVITTLTQHWYGLDYFLWERLVDS
ncbi:MAG: GNAT family N-acetyltransferase [Deinococcales bacterium]